MAWHFGERHVEEFMKGLSHREYLIWHRWLSNQWNRPNRTDHYLMQLSSDIQGLFSKQTVSVRSRKLVWESRQVKRTKQTSQSQAEAHERQIMGWLGVL